jgi:hypothetical protein
MNDSSFSAKVRRKIAFYLTNQHFRILCRDHFGRTEPIKSDVDHLKAAIAWIMLAQANSGSKGVALAYTLERGWLPAYPETTGYIINTLIRFHKLTNDASYLRAATEMGEWEVAIQRPDGGVRIRDENNAAADVFDTGMVLLGLTELYRETQDEKFLQATRKAADWLVSTQDNDGKWSRDSYKGIPHAYHSKVAWALMEAHAITKDNKYLDSARRNLEWIFSVRQSNGWFDYMGFAKDDNPFIHTIAYTLQGFWGVYKLLDVEDPWKQKLYDEIVGFSDRLIGKFDLTRKSASMFILPGELNSRWEAAATYVCLTGNAQFSIVWFELFLQTRKRSYYDAACNLLDVVKKSQRLAGPDVPYRNAIAGSYPLWGRYHPTQYPNWPAKFFADALLRKIQTHGPTLSPDLAVG